VIQETNDPMTDGARAKRETLHRYHEAVARTHRLIDPAHQRSATLPEVQQRATQRLERLRSFLAFLGNPEQQYRTVHVAGTSGKGSTATLIAALLTATGRKTGLHTSPYLQAATEKLQIDGRLISGDDFARLVDETLTQASRFFGAEPITYGELWVAMAYRWFAEMEIDTAVIEVGAGGRFDLTNVITPAVSVITSIGFDHMETLGPTLEEIAWHKAGIVKPGVPVLTAVTEPEALGPIVREAERAGTRLITIHEGTAYVVVASRDGANSLAYGGCEWALPSGTRFQAANAVMALAAAQEILGELGPFHDQLSAGLRAGQIPGRAELMQVNPRVLLDGAHNPQKMEALVSDLPSLLPFQPGGKRIAVIAALASKHHQDVLRPLLPAIDELVVTEQGVMGKPALPATDLAEEIEALGFRGPVQIVPTPREAIERAIGRAETANLDAVLVTGSLFLVGATRNRWYPEEEIILQQTPWPATVAPSFP
jgi:dihydrofolate synthase / folylpolyglutamate synthase